MELNYRRNNRYFNKTYGKLIAVGFIAGIVLIVADYLTGGIVVLAITVALLVLVIKITPSDKEMDRQLLLVMDELGGIALEKHGITEEQANKASPLILGGYMSELMGDDVKFVFKKAAGAIGGQAGQELADTAISAIESGLISGIKYKKGRDGRILASAAEFTIFQFSENQVFIYTLQFSLIGPEIKESSREYFYRDIVSISTETEKSGSHVFTIKISGGDSEEVPYGREEAPDFQQKINAFRQLIRDKKNA